MSSFFTTSSAQRKRKRGDEQPHKSGKASQISSNGSRRQDSQQKSHDRERKERDDSISSADSDGGDKNADAHPDDSADDSLDEGETAGERRLRLAEQYLENIKTEVQETVGFDAEDIDRDLIAERLQEDVAETKGRMHRHIAASLDIKSCTGTRLRMKSYSVTGVAICLPYAYTVSKDKKLVKWLLPQTHTVARRKDGAQHKQRALATRPQKLKTVMGTDKKSSKDHVGHTASILCVAASSDGRFVATGGADKKLIVYDAVSLKPLKAFPQHRDAITALSFRHGTNQLFSASKDRTLKIWSLDEMAYVETLFGHQDEVLDVAAYPTIDRCVSVGARDRTARIWKVIEETQLVFRGGGEERRKPKRDHDDNVGGSTLVSKPLAKPFAEQSMDRTAIIDNESFVTGSSNGTISLWSLNKKKAIHHISLAHGLEPAIAPHQASAELNLSPDFRVPERQPCPITALATIPLSDLVVSGSSDGLVRVWQVGADKKKLDLVTTLGQHDDNKDSASIAGVVNDIKIVDRGDQGADGVCVIVAVGKEPRFGRWQVTEARSGALIFHIPKFHPSKGKRKSSSRANGDDLE